MQPTTTFALIGATGAIGRLCVDQILADPDGPALRVFARRPASFDHPRLDWQSINFDQLDTEMDLIGCSALLCALGTTMKQAGSREAFRRVDHDYVVAAGRIAQRAEVECMATVSAIGVDSGSPVFYNRVKGETEDALVGLGLPSLYLMQPSLLLGPRVDRRPGEALGKLFAPLLTPVLRGGLRKYRPVQVADVAAHMIACATAPQPGVHREWFEGR